MDLINIKLECLKLALLRPKHVGAKTPEELVEEAQVYEIYVLSDSDTTLPKLELKRRGRPPRIATPTGPIDNLKEDTEFSSETE